MLNVRSWAPDNHAALVAHLEHWRARSAAEPLLALFDFDNTCIFHDIGEAVMRRQLEQVEFAFAPEELQSILPIECYPSDRLSSGEDLYEIRNDLMHMYRSIRRIGGTTAASRTDASLLAEFGALFAWLYEALVEDPLWGPEYAYPFLVRWQGGRTPADVRRHAVSTVREAIREEPGRVQWPVSSGNCKGRVATFATGLYPLDEMRELMRAMRTIGMTVCIISASEQHLVEGAVRALDYPVDPAHIFGMRLTLRHGILGSELQSEAHYPITYRRGKQQIVEKFLSGAPVFVAGDSDTDYEMMTGFPTTECRLLVDRGQTGLVKQLFEDPKTLLQGRDERRGGFIPAHRSLLWSDGPIMTES